MIRPGVVLGIARAETRLARRLVRYWVFTSLAILVGSALYTYYYVIHRFASGFSATVSAINPRYLIMGFGTWYLMIFAIGLIFLGFDVRSRDQRERMHEVLDSQPCSNLELVLGKFLGVFINSEKTEHEVIGLMRFNSMEHQQAVTAAMAKDERFPRLTEVMKPMLQKIEIRLIEPVE